MTEPVFIKKIKEKVNELKINLSALYLAYKRKDVSILAKIIIIMAVGYALSPIDLISDFIPIIGYLDDLLIVPLLITISIKLIPKNIMDECREQAKDLWKDGKPKKWYYAVPIIVIWLLIIFLVIYMIFIKQSA
ncbi:MAG: YkvA family protein [Treponema sp.]|nr:YkvA family protein [Treponema sp.]